MERGGGRSKEEMQERGWKEGRKEEGMKEGGKERRGAEGEKRGSDIVMRHEKHNEA